jgi:ABC-type transport system substrate-binding protein
VGTVGVGTNGSLNVLQCSVPGFDDLIDQGLHTTDLAASEAAYVKAGEAAVAYACFSPITEIRDVVATRSVYGGIHHQIATVWSIRLADITLDGSG